MDQKYNSKSKDRKKRMVGVGVKERGGKWHQKNVHNTAQPAKMEQKQTYLRPDINLSFVLSGWEWESASATPRGKD